MREKILLVDDEEANLRLLTQWLIPLGYDIALAFNGQEAVQKSRDYGPDLIILDIMMPVMDGYEVCRLIKGDPQTRNIGNHGNGALRQGIEIKGALCERK